MQQADLFLEDTQARIVYSTDAESAAKCADLVIEAVMEDMDVKKELFECLDAVCPRQVVICNLGSVLISAVDSL